MAPVLDISACSSVLGADLEDVIANFVEDTSQDTFELPVRLTTEERKRARRLTEKYDQVVCESYGFGSDRRLCLFKRRSLRSNGCPSIVGASTQDGDVRLRVKNTFIDAWQHDGSFGGSPIISPAFRSCPPNLQRAFTAHGDNLLDQRKDLLSAVGVVLAHVNVMPASQGIFISDERDSDTDTEDSLTANPEGFLACATPSSCCSMRVSETIENYCCNATTYLQDATDVPEHGNDLPSRAVAPACAPPASPCNLAFLTIGAEVEIEGLLRRPDFNGLVGTVQSWDHFLRRYVVLIQSPTGPVTVKTKRENLRLQPPPPPPRMAATEGCCASALALPRLGTSGAGAANELSPYTQLSNDCMSFGSASLGVWDDQAACLYHSIDAHLESPCTDVVMTTWPQQMQPFFEVEAGMRHWQYESYGTSITPEMDAVLEW